MPKSQYSQARTSVFVVDVAQIANFFYVSIRCIDATVIGDPEPSAD
jgi:hypothetical protein